jgi:hypothetical protein
LRILLLVVLMISSGLQTSCGGNFFKDLSTKDTDAAKYEDALKAIDLGDYASAITYIESMSTTAKAKTKTIETWAGAYAGKCGLNFISLISGLGDSSGAPFLFFMQAFTAVAVDPESCYIAQQKMELLGNSSQRTSDQNLFMFVLGISKLGTYLKASADLLPATGVGGDGVADPTFSACANQPAPGTPMMTDAQINQVVTGFGLIFDNLTAVSSSLSGASAVAGLNDFKATCEALTLIPNCAITNPNGAEITDATRLAFRELIQTSDFGVGTACTKDQVGIPDGFGGTQCCP